mgnify:CR=1 FL=1
MKYILASASPRRQELLKYIVNDFDISPADIDETIPDCVSSQDAAEFLAVKKAAHVAKQYPNSVVIGCDTVVIINDMILGKPHDKHEAEKMLNLLSGRTHNVITGVCFFKNGVSRSFSEITSVTFYSLSQSDIDNYITTKDPFDKAGGYGIQGVGSVLVKGIIGDFFNVVGLPVARLKRELNEFIQNI